MSSVNLTLKKQNGIYLLRRDSRNMIILVFYNNEFDGNDFDLTKPKDQLTFLAIDFDLKKNGWKLPLELDAYPSHAYGQI